MCTQIRIITHNPPVSQSLQLSFSHKPSVSYWWFYTPLGLHAAYIYQPETGACSLHTTSLFSENTPSCKLSRAIHLKGSLTLPPDLSCLKYPDLYMSSASPKSATLITQSPSILSTWEMLSKLQSALQARLQFVKEKFQKVTYMQFLAARSRCTNFCDAR